MKAGAPTAAPADRLAPRRPEAAPDGNVPARPTGLPDLSALPDLDPAWSRLVSAPDGAGVVRTWHVLDNGAEPTRGTLLCVHGNPTWSYLWRRFVASAPPGWRVVAVDQIGMGWSERPQAARTLAERVDDLGALTATMDINGPVVTLAHDWGGPVSLGWALAHRGQLAGVVLTNTAVHQPPGAAAPTLIRLARTPALRQAVCVTTPMFVRATTALSRPALPAAVRDAFAAPYAGASRRRAVADFVADIPIGPDHPSMPTLSRIADGLAGLSSTPVLLLWGPRDPVFSQRYLRDLLARLPHAQVHRYEGASHLVTEDAPQSSEHVWRWVAELGAVGSAPHRPAAVGTAEGRPLWSGLVEHAGDTSPAVVELTGGRRVVPFAQLERRVRQVAAGMSATGIRAGDRVALLVPPGADLTVAVYACWRLGAVIVVADAGLGFTAMGRALRGAGPDHVIGIARGLAAARALRVPGRRIGAGAMSRPALAAVGATHGLPDLARIGAEREASDRLEPAGDRLPGSCRDGLPPAPGPEAECAVVFTSGATGPPKGVVYRHRQVHAQLEALRTAYGIGPQDRLVAAFAPFALYGPALGIASAVPDMDVTAPDTLTARALAEAVSAVDATLVFASPAALRNVVATAGALTSGDRRALAGVRVVLSAGAPVPVRLLRAVREVMPAAKAHTPYGMTEALPVADIELSELEAVGAGNGVCVGAPLAGVAVQVSPLTHDGAAEGDLTLEPEITGEICVRAAHVKDRYDRLWATERESSRTAGWHRTGDVGHLDATGRLWVEGRLVHVIVTADGPVTPVGVEQRVESLEAVRSAAVVGVGPRGTQQVVVVLTPAGEGVAAERSVGGRFVRRPAVLADARLSAAVRSVARVPVAAVLQTDALPVDIRHASKVDRAAVARWASRVLTGGRARRP